MSLFSKSLLIGISFLYLAACSSGAVKGRRDQREKLMKDGGKVYCEFLNSEAYPDIDVALNLEMAKRCDADKSFTITNYKSQSETSGIVYCCTMPEKPSAAFNKPDKKDDLSFEDKPKPEVSKPAAAPAAAAKPEPVEDKKDKK